MIQDDPSINEITVESLADYIEKITEIKTIIEEREGNDADPQKLFFRGQANKGHGITPGAFRKNFLPLESRSITSAYMRNPSEFRTLPTDFERLAKLQHYGLPTRLLDVTFNPLVALYFACQPSTSEPTADGVVFFQRAYGIGHTALEVSVISHLAIQEDIGNITLDELLDELVDQHIYSAKAAKKCRENGYKSLISILQSNYFVISNLNNERLTRQSGSFILAGSYNIAYHSSNVGSSTVSAALSSLRSEFDEEMFVIPQNLKSKILEELDLCNINEGTLFPELEHQMAYIKNSQSGNSLPSVGIFSKLDLENLDSTTSSLLPKELSAEEIGAVLDDILPRHINRLLVDDCKNAVIKNLSVDWYKRDNILSGIRVAISTVLRHNGVDLVSSKNAAQSIVDELLEKVNELCAD